MSGVCGGICVHDCLQEGSADVCVKVRGPYLVAVCASSFLFLCPVKSGLKRLGILQSLLCILPRSTGLTDILLFMGSGDLILGPCTYAAITESPEPPPQQNL